MLLALIYNLAETFKKVTALKVAGFIVLGIGIFMGIVYLSMYLWNATVPDVFGLNEISYWQAFRLYLLLILIPIGKTSSK